MQFYGEHGRGGGEEDRRRRTTRSRPSGTGSSGGAVFYWDAPPPPHDFQVIPAAQSGSKTPGSGAPRRADLGAASQALAGARKRREVSEGSLPRTERAPPEQSGAEGATRKGESTSARNRAGEGSGIFGWSELRRGGRPGGKIRGRPVRHYMDPVRDGQLVKVHCRQREGIPGTERSWRGDKERGEHKRTEPGGGRLGNFRME